MNGLVMHRHVAIVMTFSLMWLLISCGGSSASGSAGQTPPPVSTPATATLAVEPIILATAAIVPAVTLTPSNSAGHVPTYTANQLAEMTEVAPAPAPLAAVAHVADFNDAQMLIAALPASIGDLVKQEPALTPGVYRVGYLPTAVDPMSRLSTTVAVVNLPESGLTFPGWTVDDWIASALALTAEGIPHVEGGRDGELYWSKKNGVTMTILSWGQADSTILFQLTSPSEAELARVLEALAHIR